MSGGNEEQDKQLLFRILQESDDEDDEEIDKIILANIAKNKDKMTTGINNIYQISDHLFYIYLII